MKELKYGVKVSPLRSQYFMNNTVASFTDISQHCAYPFIQGLQRQGVVSGFKDRTFRPDQTMTRAEFASIVQAAFSLVPQREYVPFTDVPADFWAAEAIRNTFRSRFISGFPDGRFLAGENISRLHVLLALVSGLQMQAGASVSLTAIYKDGGNIPNYAQQAIATATQNGLVVNAPTIDILNPNRPATRGEVAACIYQARVFLNQSPIVASPYIVELANPGVIRRGTHLSVNGRTWRAAWGQWSSGICTYTGVS
ncbi:MAG: S-layer homology domain-containing protein, partial [Limnospira maxima]